MTSVILFPQLESLPSEVLNLCLNFYSSIYCLGKELKDLGVGFV